MSTGKSIEIVIDPETGSVEIEMTGFKGKSCLDASKFIEQALGDPVMRKKTKEFYAFHKQGTEFKEYCG